MDSTLRDAKEHETLRVTLAYPECRADESVLELTIEFSIHGQSNSSIRTTIPFSDVPPASRARTLAVAIAESIRVTRLLSHEQAVSERGPALPAPIEPRPRPLPPVEGAPKPTDLGRHPLSVGVGLQVASLAKYQGAFGGIAAMVGFEFASRWRATMRFGYLTKSADSAFGRVDFDVYSGTVGTDWVCSRAPYFTLGPEVTLMSVRAQGDSYLGFSESVHTRTVVASAVRSTLEVPIYGKFNLTTSANLAVTLKDANYTAGREKLARFSGFQWGGIVGVSFRP
jgi:hypothetical protein